METRVSANPRYIGSYHWSAYWGQWDKILEVDGIWWVVAKCDLEGNLINKPRRHCTPLEASKFAVKPFDVKGAKA